MTKAYWDAIADVDDSFESENYGLVVTVKDEGTFYENLVLTSTDRIKYDINLDKYPRSDSRRGRFSFLNFSLGSHYRDYSILSD